MVSNLEHQDSESDCNGSTYTKYMVPGKCVHDLLNHCYQLLCDVCEDDVEV